MCNENDKINVSEWTLDRIQTEQDKHMSFKVTGVIPTVDPKQVENNLDALDSALDAYIRKVTEDTDIYIICEIAKLYIESQRPAEWERVNGCGGLYVCTNCGENTTETVMGKPRFNFCPNCGRRMKNGC